MSKNVDKGSSLRSGALILKSISIFLASGRNASKSSVNQKASLKSNKLVRIRRMNEKDNKNKISSRLLETLKRETHFSRLEIEALYRMYKQMISSNKLKANFDQSANNTGASIMRKPSSIQEGITRTVFCELLHNSFDIITEDIVIDRIICVLDKDNLGVITLQNWFTGLSTFLRGSFAEQIHFCFAIYDLNADGYITKDEMFQLLKNCLIKQPQEEDPDESIKELVEIILKKMDVDKDGKVSLEDYKVAVSEEPLLLEAFGACLPSDGAKETFLSALKN